MATPEQRDACRRVANLILEEIAGCGEGLTAGEVAELKALVAEMERRIIEGPPPFPASRRGRDKVVIQRRGQRPAKAPAEWPPKWTQGPLASAAGGAAPKPPWFSED